MEINKDHLLNHSCFVNLAAFVRYCKENHIPEDKQDEAWEIFEKEHGMTLREWLKQGKSHDKIKV